MTEPSLDTGETRGWRRLLELSGGRLGRQTLVTLFFQVGSLGLAFIVAVVLARILDTDGYGAYALAIAWIELLMLPATLGIESLMVREMAQLQEVDPSRSRAYSRWSTRTVLVTSLLTAIIGGGLIIGLQTAQEPDAVLVQVVALALLPMWAMTRIWQGTLRGVGRIYIGQTPESLLVPIFILAAVGTLALTELDLTPAVAMGLRLTGVGLALAVLGLVMRRALPPGPVVRLPRTDARALIRSALALSLISAIFIVATRTDIVMLGALADLEAVGSYTVASRGAGFVVFPISGLHIVVAPVIASLYASGNRDRLQRVLKWAARFGVLAALPIALGLLLFGNLYLDIFGEGFGIGLGPLRILTLGTLVASAAGTTGLIMIMTGHEVSAARVVGGAAVVNVILNLVLIPLFGSVGAAWSTVISTNLWTYMLAVWIWRNLRADPTIVGLTPREGATGDSV